MSGKEIKSNFIQNIQSSPYNFLIVFSFSNGVCFLVSVDSCILLLCVNYLSFTIHSATFLKELVSLFFFFFFFANGLQSESTSVIFSL